MVGCGGGSDAGAQAQAADGASAAAADASVALLAGVPAGASALPDQRIAAVATPAAPATSLRVHYRRADGNHAGWQIHTWNAAQSPNWNAGWNASGSDDFGVYYDVPLAAGSGTVGFLFHLGDTKDNGGADQSYVLQSGANEIWRLEGDNTNYTSNPRLLPVPDIKTVRVHYKRFDGAYSAWGLHLWNGSGLDAARLPAGVTIEDWNNPVAFDKLAGYSLGAAEVVFDIPVLNPKDDATRKTLEFIIHGQNPNQGDKDGRNDNIVVNYSALTVSGQVGQIWLVQQDATVYTAVPDTRQVATTDARAYWLNKTLLQWPRVDTAGVFKLYHSATGQLTASKDGTVGGADGAITLDVNTAALPSAAAARFAWVSPGVVLAVKAADAARLASLHTAQLLLVQEDASGKVQNATTAQTPGALDDQYAAAAAVNDLGVKVSSGSTGFKLWAPTAQKVSVCTYDSATGGASAMDAMAMDAATGVWSASKPADLSGKYYKYVVEVFVRGVGVVRNLVTDPYSVSLTTDSARSWIGSLDAAATQPAGWSAQTVPATVAHPTDMVVYELHVRDFSANDASVSAANRGKYLAFTDLASNGMRHLRALAQALAEHPQHRLAAEVGALAAEIVTGHAKLPAPGQAAAPPPPMPPPIPHCPC